MTTEADADIYEPRQDRMALKRDSRAEKLVSELPGFSRSTLPVGSVMFNAGAFPRGQVSGQLLP